MPPHKALSAPVPEAPAPSSNGGGPRPTLFLCGINHAHAPLYVRERFAFDADRCEALLARLKRSRLSDQILLLSTCNRTELYALGGPAGFAPRLREAYLSLAKPDPEAPVPPLYEREGDEAARHLFGVGAGLDSLLLGETQIKQQVQQAHAISVRAGTSGPHLHRLIEAVHRAGKRIRTETKLNVGTLDLGRAAVLHAERELGGLKGRRCIVIGAGKIGRIVLREIASRHPARLVVVNRSVERAGAAAKGHEAESAGLDALPGLIGSADFILGAAYAPELILTLETFATARAAATRPICIVDAAMPRIIDPSIAGLAGVKLFDVEHMTVVIEENRRHRQVAARRAWEVVDDELALYRRQEAEVEMGPRIRFVAERIASIFAAERRRLEEICPAEIRAKVLESNCRLEQQVMHEAIAGLKARMAPPTAGV